MSRKYKFAEMLVDLRRSLQIIQKKISREKLGNIDFEWFDEKRLKTINYLLKCFDEIKKMGLRLEIAELLTVILVFVKRGWNKADKEDERRLAGTRKHILRLFSRKATITEIRSLIGRLIQTLEFIGSNQARMIIPLQESIAQNIRERYGSIEAYLNSLELIIIHNAGDSRLAEIYALYEGLFPIPEERESLDGFDYCLASNSKADLQQKYGFFREFWVALKDPVKNEVLAGGNFAFYSTTQEGKKYGVDGTVHGIYFFMHPMYRKLGLEKLLIIKTREYINQTLCKGNVVVFVEVNDPYAMTIKEYMLDSSNAMIDQLDRIMFWNSLRLKPLAFRYVQPPLKKNGKACFGLMLFASNVINPMPSVIIKDHLTRFFDISVLKGRDSTREPTVIEQFGYLDRNPLITFRAIDLSGMRRDIQNIFATMHWNDRGKPIGKLIATPA